MSQNDETAFKNLAAFSEILFKCEQFFLLRFSETTKILK